MLTWQFRHARPKDWIGRAFPGEERLPAVPGAHVARAVVAILAQVGNLLRQEPLVDAAVGRVARGAVLVNRGMLKHIRAPLLRMTLIAELVDARGLDH